jgi:hypothetical protein
LHHGQSFCSFPVLNAREPSLVGAPLPPSHQGHVRSDEVFASAATTVASTLALCVLAELGEAGAHHPCRFTCKSSAVANPDWKLPATALLGSGWSTGEAHEPSDALAVLLARRRATRTEEGLLALIAIPDLSFDIRPGVLSVP